MVNSLSSTEKAYFRKFASSGSAGKDKTYLQLFDAFDKLEYISEYSEESVKQRFSGKRSLRQLPVLKNYLYGTILRALNHYNEESDIDLKIGSIISSAKLLYRKGLFKASLAKTAKAGAMARKFGKDILLLEAIHTERQTLRVYSSLNQSSELLMKNYDEEAEVLERLNNISVYKKLLDELIIMATASGPATTGNETLRYEKLLKRRELSDENLAICTQSKILFHQIKSFAMMLSGGRLDESLVHTYKVIELIDATSNGRMNYPYEYISSRQNTILAELYRNGFEAASRAASGLRAEEDGLLANSPAKVRNFLKIRTLSCEINMNMTCGEHERNSRLIEEEIKYCEANRNNTYRDEEIVTWNQAAMHYFVFGDYSRSLEYIARIMNDNSFRLREDMQTFCRLFALILHFDMGSLSYIEHYTKSLYRYLMQRKLLNPAERTLLKFIVDMQDVSSKNELQVLLNDYLNILSKGDYAGAFSPFNVIAWINSKLNKSTYSTECKLFYNSLLQKR
ncbi:MAG: hypothetical protein IAE90_13800 [Ignavibacteria bacterium]|nr:hypothetical protein [Ignavibacteria bacterium]